MTRNLTPTTHKFVAVLNQKIETGKLMNALGHMAAGLVGLFPDQEVLRFDTYIDKDGGEHRSISDNPFIVLSAKNSNQIYTLRQNLVAAELPFVDFPETMTIGTFAEQKASTSQTPAAELEYYGLCTFGEVETINQYTKKFSLWR